MQVITAQPMHKHQQWQIKSSPQYHVGWTLDTGFQKISRGPADHHLIVTLDDEYCLNFCEVGHHRWVKRVKADDKILLHGFSYMRRDKCQHTETYRYK